MKFPIKNIQNANQLAELLDGEIFHRLDEGTHIIVFGDEDHYDSVVDDVQEMLNNEEIIHEDFYDTVRKKLNKDTSFICL